MRTLQAGMILMVLTMAACGSDAERSGDPGASGGTSGSSAGGSAGTSGSGGTPSTGGTAGGFGGMGASGGASGSSGGGAGAGAGGSAGSGTSGPSSWIGVPNPPFGITETAADCTGCVKITANGPSDLDNLAPGTIVELSSSFSCNGNVLISGTGTAAQPIFVRGPSPTQKVKIPCQTGVMGSYIIVENVDFDFTGQDISFGFASSDHVALRTSDVHGVRANSNGTVVFLHDSTDVVIYENSIFDNGDFAVSGELDIHGIGGSQVWRVWILNNQMFSNRGDSVQFGHKANNTLGDIYIAGNDMYDNGENAVDIKEASNVVISQNKLHGDNPMCNVVLHDCPKNAAVIYNEIYDESVGLSMPSLESGCSGQPISLFVLKNEFHDISDNAVQAWGSGKRYFVAGNDFQSVATPIEIDNAGSGSVISEDDNGLAQGFAEFKAVYGLDISTQP